MASKALPRARRKHPQGERIFSANFPKNIEEKGGCFVPLEDFKKVETNYFKLFRRYQRELAQPRQPIGDRE